MLAETALIAVGYLLGSIPTGLLLASTSGVDIRAEGSGNIGATNVARTAGRRLGVLTLAGDLAKGLLAVVLARSLGAAPWVSGAVAFAAVAGHVFPVFLRFRGGKGVATGFGVLLGLCPGAALWVATAFVLIFGVSRIVSLASIGASLAAPAVVWALGSPWPIVAAAGGITLIVLLRHRDNLGRLAAGTEPRFRARP